MGQIENSFVDHLCDTLAPWGEVVARRLFGSIGLYRAGFLFGFVGEDTVYLKCGAHLRALADGQPLTLFTYNKTIKQGEKTQEKKVQLNFAALDPALLDDNIALIRWAEAAWQDALASRRDATGGKPHIPMRRKYTRERPNV